MEDGGHKRCLIRVRERKRAEYKQKIRQMKAEKERLMISETKGIAAAEKAAKRLREKAKMDNKTKTKAIDELIEQQFTSLDAMTVAQMLSPRMQSKVTKFTPNIPKHSKLEERVDFLLTSPRIGHFYR